MQFGFFKDDSKEYVISNPDTPRSWTNYLGNTEYGAIITNNAGGYSFFKSAAQGRFLRFRFNSIPNDQPGRYLYLRDKESGDYWTNSWMPVAKPLTQIKSECIHGTGYTVIRNSYNNIQSEITYFVPLDKNYECWLVKVKNEDKKKRKLTCFTFVEYANNWNGLDDLNNLQYTQYILKMDYLNEIIDHGTNTHIPPMPHNFQEKDQGRHSFLTLTGESITGFDTDRDKFIGSNRGYNNPIVVERGFCENSIAEGDNGCGVLQVDVEIDANEEKEFLVIMGVGSASEEGSKLKEKYKNIRNAKKELEELKIYWHSKLDKFIVKTTDEDFNSNFNIWNQYNCLITYSWSRTASLIYAGERDGLGFRDSLQDMLGILHMIPDQARERIELLITGQLSNGGAMPVVKPFAHKPGFEKEPQPDEYRSDDCMWFFNTIPDYVKETGDIEFFKKQLPYADKSVGTVFEHLKRAIEFTIERSGINRLPVGLSADWNDCIRLGETGETVFVAFQLRFALKTFIEICELIDNKDDIDWAVINLKNIDTVLSEICWDGEWYLRAIRGDGFKFGSKESEEGKIFLNPQTWSIISGHASAENAFLAMDKVREYLLSPYGLMICDPPFENTDHNIMRAALFNKGMKENAGIFCHTQGWAVIAESILGRGNIAYEYFRAYMPSAYNDKAEIREVEPYVYCQSTHSKYSNRYGASRVPWLSGSATWAFYSASKYILGIQPDYDFIKFDPCIPSHWDNVRIKRIIRGKELNILINNPKKIEKGVEKIILDGVVKNRNSIKYSELNAISELKIIMG